MARTKEESQLIAIKTNITKWSNAIEKYTGGTEVYSVVGVSKDDWEQMHPNDKWHLIDVYKSDKDDLKLERNKKTLSDADYKRLLNKIAEAESDDERNQLLDMAKIINAYDKAKTELDNAKTAYEKAKKRLDDAKSNLKQIEEELDNIEID